MEAAPGIEPGIKVLQTSALPLGYAATISNSSRVIFEAFFLMLRKFYRGIKEPTILTAPASSILMLTN
jgi:hypothetical protein